MFDDGLHFPRRRIAYWVRRMTAAAGGGASVASALQRSESLISKWSDENATETPSLSHGLELLILTSDRGLLHEANRLCGMGGAPGELREAYAREQMVRNVMDGVYTPEAVEKMLRIGEILRSGGEA